MNKKKIKQNKTTRTKTRTPPPLQKTTKNQQQRSHDVDDIQVIHTNLSTAASGIHLRIKRTIGEGGGDPYTFILLLSRHQNKRREYTMELTHIFEITLSFKLWFQEKKFAVDLVKPRGVYLSGR